MSEELNVLKIVCQKLEAAAIPYMLTGSLAANLYAVPRMTRDIDIVIEIQKLDVASLFDVFQEDFYVSRHAMQEAVEHRGMFNIIHNKTVIKIDFIVRKNVDYRETEFRKRRQILVGNFPIWIVSPEDLIISKLGWAKAGNSDLQLRDVAGLLRALKNLDHEYMDHWIKNLGLEHMYDKVKAHG